MSTSITKQGILLADGSNVGENLILNGNALAYNGTYVAGASGHWTNWSSSVTVRSIEHIYGKDWFHFQQPSSGYGGFNQNPSTTGNVIEIKPNTYYTVSGIWFASVPVHGRYWLHLRSTEGGANISQRATVLEITTAPTRYFFTFNSGSSSSYTINRFNLMCGGYFQTGDTAGADVYFTDIKMEEGQIATPYTPSSLDDIYVGDHGFFEGSDKGSIGKGYMEGNEFYEY